ncbi:integral membrane sensor signal transduction histidine kinase [Paenibacillus curdlanolyticus YK9]|uniref:histidine kinase n=1 Tax=Paenibacillus curdlanolyticus YK9 TaxID=717606 RepID=E0IEX0_9BACL|nr:sensor histidine kinase [Paenibacillus curdlanolyticus]EFM09208.1 integral membrane sensor signal transduction histidine kinase [Paenibacillus curdlanolyticus YK9]
MIRGFRSIRTRLFILLLVSMVSLLSVVSYLYYQRATDQYHDKVTEIAEKNVRQTMQVYDLLLDSYNSLSKSLIGNSDLLRKLPETHEDNPALAFINERAITNILGTLFYSREDIVSIHVFSPSGAVYSYGNYMNTVDPYFSYRDWYNRIKKSDGDMVWLGVFKHSLTDQTVNQPVFAFGRQLYDLTEHKPIGVLLFQMNVQPVVSALTNMRLGPNSETYILSEDGRLLASDNLETAAEVPWSIHAEIGTRTPNSSEAAIARAADSGTGAETDNYTTASEAIELLATMHNNINAGEVAFENRKQDLVVASKATEVDWTFVSRTPNKDLNVELDQTKHYFVIVVSVLVIVSIAIATFISRTITSPVKRLVQEMRQVEVGNFRGSVKAKSSYEEIDILVASFNQMVHRMDDLINREKETSAREKQAQLQALQSQVNPHFLYNTLDMIYWMLDEQENNRLGSIVLSLSHMFQYSSHWNEDLPTTLGEELEQIRHYLTIIEARLEDRLTAEIEVGNEWLDVPMPKMTLQPIIENAVKHGLEPALRPGKLTLHTEVDGQRLYITIADNGVGIEHNALVQLQTALGQETNNASAVASKGRRGIGIANVHHRLVLMHGESYGLTVNSVLGKGTTIKVTLPLPPRA